MNGEFDFIDFIRDSFAAMPDNGFEGIGDDCTVVETGGGEALVMTTDMLVEEVHFLRRAASARELGRKSLAVNLSDVAAMGAQPVASMLSIALPHDVDRRWAEEFIEGYRSMSEPFGVKLVGGDTTAAPSRIAINVVAIGRAPVGCIKRRSAARAGDIIAVTGTLGQSAAGLADILSGRLDTAAAAVHRDPQPHVRQGVWLGRRAEVHAMMDISDGLASDLGHMARLSGVAAEVECDAVPHPDATLEQAVCGGEDYRLLLTADSEAFERLAADYMAEFGSPLYPLGRIAASADHTIHWFSSGSRITPDWHGFTHF